MLQEEYSYHKKGNPVTERKFLSQEKLFATQEEACPAFYHKYTKV